LVKKRDAIQIRLNKATFIIS